MTTRLLRPASGDGFALISAASAATIPPNFLLLADTSGAAWTATLPPGVEGVAAAVQGSFAANNLTVQGQGGDLIDGAASETLDDDNELAVYLFDRGQWRRTIPVYRYGGNAAAADVERIADLVTALPAPPEGAVIFDGGDPQNLRSNRPTDQSPIDNTKNGIVNLSSDTTGFAIGATGEFATIGGGDQHSATGAYSTVPGGINCHASGISSFAAGNSGYATQAGAVSFSGYAFGIGACQIGNGTTQGENANGLGACDVDGENSFGAGLLSTTRGDRAVAIGSHGTVFADDAATLGTSCEIAAGGVYACATGVRAAAARSAEHVHGHSPAAAGVVQSQNGYAVYGSSVAAAPVVLVDAAGNSLEVENGKSYSLRARVVATRTDAVGADMSIRELLVSCTGGVASVVEALILPFSTALAITFTVTGASNEVIATFTGIAGETWSAAVKYEGIELGGGP